MDEQRSASWLEGRRPPNRRWWRSRSCSTPARSTGLRTTSTCHPCCSTRTRGDRRLRLLLRLAARHPAPDRLPAGHRRRAFRRARRALRHQARRPAAGGQHRPLLGLEARATTTSTTERLRAAVAAGRMSEPDAATLEEAFDLFSELRLDHQVRQIEAGIPPDNLIDPKTLNALNRRYLREAFRAVASVQRTLTTKLRGPSPRDAAESSPGISGHADARSASTGWREAPRSACSTSRPPGSNPETTRSSPSERCRSRAAGCALGTPDSRLVRPDRMPEQKTIVIHGLRQRGATGCSAA